MLRILISTDNHLGVWEKDEIRGEDSFNTMDEVMRIAKREVGSGRVVHGLSWHGASPALLLLIC